MKCGNNIRRRYRTSAEEVCPTRDTDDFQRNLAKKMDVRLIKEIRDRLKVKVKGSYSQDCNQQLCPVIREKRDRHKRKQHATSKDMDAINKSRQFRDQAIMVPNTLFHTAHANNEKFVQTVVTMKDLDYKFFADQGHHLSKVKSQPNSKILLKTSVSNDGAMRKSYKKKIENEILNWFQRLPIDYTLQSKSHQISEDVVNKLSDKINKYALYVNEDKYEIEVKHEIEKCMNILPLSLQGSAHDQVLFKKGLQENLYCKIKELNDKLCYDKVLKLQSVDLYEKIVADWLKHFKCKNYVKTINKLQAMDTLLEKMIIILKQYANTTSSKIKIKGDIMNTLDNLPIILSNSKNRKVQLNKLAEDLANRLLYIHLKQRKRVITETDILKNVMPMVNKALNELGNENVKGCLDVNEQQPTEAEVACPMIDLFDPLEDNVQFEIWNELPDRTTGNENSVFKPEMSQNVSIYSYPVTSTSKKSKSKWNTEEKSYMDKLKTVIRSWMDTLPQKFDEDEYKETVIEDLAGGIMDRAKLVQLSPTDNLNEKEEDHMGFIVYRWLNKFLSLDNRESADLLVKDLLQKIKHLPVPVLTASQGGTRQEIQNIKFQEKWGGNETFVPQSIDILEDQISIWMNKQPLEIYDSKDKNKRTNMAHELALQLQYHLRNKIPEDDIDNVIKEWLHKMVTPGDREHIDNLTQNLKDKVINIPQDETLERKQQERKKYKADYKEAKRKAAEKHSEQNEKEISNFGNIEGDPDFTIKQFIAKYLQNSHVNTDPLARGAFDQVLKTELRKLSALARQEVYDNLDKSSLHSQFPSQKMNREFELIKIISDWLKQLPIDASYNTSGSKDRVEFVTDLVRNIQEIEEQREVEPHQMDYNVYLRSIINQSINTYSLPILQENISHIPLMVDELMFLIDTKLASPFTTKQVDESSKISQNLSELIEEYIQLNLIDISDDPITLDIWAVRLSQEINKMAQEGTDLTKLTKEQIYTIFTEVPIPKKYSVERLTLQIENVKNISEWIKNLPLLPNEYQPKTEPGIIKMITELSDQIVRRKLKKQYNTDDAGADEELCNYLEAWISKLPLDPRKEVVLPLVIQQLMNRIDNENHIEPDYDNPISSLSCPCTTIDEKNKKSNKNFKKKTRDPGSCIVEAVEKWSSTLPIGVKDKNKAKSIENTIARNLYQKIAELNMDPRTFHDDVLYKDLLADEIKTQLENIPLTSESRKNKDLLKEELIDDILEQKEIIRKKSTGDNYKHKLETTIDASIPHPIQNRYVLDPEFEIYKNHLADMFILQNFDHSNDLVKVAYENRIRKEIDKYFESAQNKSSIPLTKDQIYNELYSPLFKVPAPDEKLLINEVEEVKTKCEIDAWFEQLPLNEPNGVPELLEWDRILSTLAKKIHEIENTEAKPDDHIQREIKRWLTKLPLQSGQQKNIDEFVINLQRQLKASAKQRKYEPHNFAKKSKGKSLISKVSYTRGKNKQNISQEPGPSIQDDIIRMNTPSKTTSNKCCKIYKPYKKPSDMIIEIVADWCSSLPLLLSEEEAKTIKDNLSTKIILKINELNIDPQIFKDNDLYCKLLHDELDNFLTNLPVPYHFAETKPVKIYQLTEAINSIKPLIKQEHERHKYKEELNHTVDKVLEEPQIPTPEQQVILNQIKEEIVENYILQNYHEGDDNLKINYKQKLNDAVNKFITEFKPTEEEYLNPLMTYNRLYCELNRVPVPNNSILKEESEEIKIKSEVEKFFEGNVSEIDTANTKYMKLTEKNTLIKKLNDLNKSGNTTTTNNKMKSQIERCLNKIETHVSPKTISDFVEKIEKIMTDRRGLPKPIEIEAPQNTKNGPGCIGTGTNHILTESRFIPTQCPNNDSLFDPEKWMTFSSFGSTESCDPTVSNYEGFDSGAVLTSTIGPQHREVPITSLRYPNKIKQSISSAAQSMQATPQEQTLKSKPLSSKTTQIALNRSKAPKHRTKESLLQPTVVERKPLNSPFSIPSIENLKDHLSQTFSKGTQVPPRGHRHRERSTASRQSSEEDERCKCNMRKKRKKQSKKRRARPYFIMCIEEYCDQCGRYMPVWYPMPMPSFLYL